MTEPALKRARELMPCNCWPLGDKHDADCPSQHWNSVAAALDAWAQEARLEEAKELREALDRVNDIRNSIIGCQGFNFSMHAYPLVAALGAVGIEGMSYKDAFAKQKEIDAKILKWQVEANERIAALEQRTP